MLVYLERGSTYTAEDTPLTPCSLPNAHSSKQAELGLYILSFHACQSLIFEVTDVLAGAVVLLAL